MHPPWDIHDRACLCPPVVIYGIARSMQHSKLVNCLTAFLFYFFRNSWYLKMHSVWVTPAGWCLQIWQHSWKAPPALSSSCWCGLWILFPAEKRWTHNIFQNIRAELLHLWTYTMRQQFILCCCLTLMFSYWFFKNTSMPQGTL